jgi:hypothetical protein
VKSLWDKSPTTGSYSAEADKRSVCTCADGRHSSLVWREVSGGIGMMVGEIFTCTERVHLDHDSFFWLHLDPGRGANLQRLPLSAFPASSYEHTRHQRTLATTAIWTGNRPTASSSSFSLPHKTGGTPVRQHNLHLSSQQRSPLLNSV